MNTRNIRLSTVFLLVSGGCSVYEPIKDTAIVVTVEVSDQDGDTIADLHEGYIDASLMEGESSDFDGDGTYDYLDLDSDGDGISDSIEAGDEDALTLPWDTDVDGAPNFIDLDSDGNCILDEVDGTDDLDGDGVGAFADLDDDGDGIDDIYEIGELCVPPDADQDGTPDYLDIDSDGDGIGDQWEAGTSAWEREPVDTDGDGTPDYLDDDSDGDGLSDSDESGVDSPEDEPVDTDGDGIYDSQDTDSDGDGVSDADERDVYGTDPYDADSDDDGYSDGAEVVAGTDPADGSSIIDGLYVTVDERVSIEKDFTFELNVRMGDIGFLIDTTGSMSSTINAMSSEFSQIVSSLTSTLPDAEYGVATYDDYACCGYGYPTSSDKPFQLLKQVTSNVSTVQSTLSSIDTHFGGDGPESGMEALYQALSGAGYDHDCNGSYNATTDVRPFMASSSDPFGGSGGQFYNTSLAGGGAVGGFGFREYALPIVVYATDNYLRDPDNGYGSPGGCPGDAGFSDVVAASNDIGAFLIGIAARYNTPRSQMEALADATSSYADTDGDGLADDRLVFSWSGSSATLRNTITNAIEDLVSSVRFEQISLQVDGDEHGFITNIQPETYAVSSTASGQIVSFTLTFRGAVAATEEDQVHRVTLRVIGDGSVMLDTLDIFVVVPGGTY